VLTIANQLTLLRMLLIPAFIVLIVEGERGWALLVFAVAGVTDALDGVIARRWGKKTTLGAWLDPMADKLMLVSAFVVLTLPNLGLANKLPNGLLLGVLVDQGDGRAEGDGVAGKLRHVDDFGARELVLELGDVALVERLRFLGGVIFGVLGQIAVGPGVRDLLDDARPLDLLAMFQFGLERGVTRPRHGNFVHRSQTSKPAKSKLASRSDHRPAAAASLVCTVPRPGRALFFSFGPGREITLQRAHLEVAFEIGPDTLRCGDSP